jgi:hypothetical protein
MRWALFILLLFVGRGVGIPKTLTHSVESAYKLKGCAVSNDIKGLCVETKPACVKTSKDGNSNRMVLRGGRGDPDDRKEVGCFNPFLACFLVRPNSSR